MQKRDLRLVICRNHLRRENLNFLPVCFFVYSPRIDFELHGIYSWTHIYALSHKVFFCFWTIHYLLSYCRRKIFFLIRSWDNTIHYLNYETEMNQTSFGFAYKICYSFNFIDDPRCFDQYLPELTNAEIFPDSQSKAVHTQRSRPVGHYRSIFCILT